MDYNTQEISSPCVMMCYFCKNNQGLTDFWQPCVCLKFLKYFQVIYNDSISVCMGQNVFGNHYPFTRPHGRAKMMLPFFTETVFLKVNSLKEELGKGELLVQAQLMLSYKVRVIGSAQSGIITIKYFWYLYKGTDNRWHQASNLPQIGPKIGF